MFFGCWICKTYKLFACLYRHNGSVHCRAYMFYCQCKKHANTSKHFRCRSRKHNHSNFNDVVSIDGYYGGLILGQATPERYSEKSYVVFCAKIKDNTILPDKTLIDPDELIWRNTQLCSLYTMAHKQIASLSSISFLENRYVFFCPTLFLVYP